MTRRERVLEAVAHHSTDILPYQVELTIPARERLEAYVKDPGYVDRIGSHLLTYSWRHEKEQEIKPGYFCDAFGVVWNRSGADKDIGNVDEYLVKEPTLKGFIFPVLDEASVRSGIEAAFAGAGDRCVCGALGFSLFERAWTLRGMENLLADMASEPVFVHEFLDAICQFNLSVLRIYDDYPFESYYFGDDWGQQHGTIMGPSHWRTFIKPRLARMYGHARSSGRFVLQHSCGDIHELFPDLIEIGLDVYNTVQPEIYDLKALKREFGRDLTFYGAISTQRLLPFASPDEVKRVTRETMDLLGQGGGYIASPTHDVPGDVPPENIVAMVEVFQNQ